MVAVGTLLWIGLIPISVIGYCQQNQHSPELENFIYVSKNITAVVLQDLDPVAFGRINLNHGRCLKCTTQFRDTVLTIEIRCDPGEAKYVETVDWRASEMEVDLFLIKMGKTIVGFDLLLCNLANQTSGVLAVHNPYAYEYRDPSYGVMKYDEECACDYLINITISYDIRKQRVSNSTGRINDPSTVNQAEDKTSGEGLPKQYKIIVAGLMLIIILMLCIACSYF
ncbi:tRNA nucleotidyltransferasepolyA-polymerase [Anopheles sinensis]|uniref:tRNA nucleotidyltransferasepolyA-polymerase n=1 Tax=Anopheles sinensis TaxID=74873 RepID=A0A084VGK2_ANOSI|nr:tRNA nucleotidyltransferasepolyA-polymerase [Anopheles sinensis]